VDHLDPIFIASMLLYRPPELTCPIGIADACANIMPSGG